MNSHISKVAEQLKNSRLPLIALAVPRRQQNDQFTKTSNLVAQNKDAI